MAIEDSRLVLLYNLAFMGVVGSLVGNLFLHTTYLQSDSLHGIAQARLKTPVHWAEEVEGEEAGTEDFFYFE